MKTVVKSIREIADRWAGAECTLDGEPAKILGRRLSFATVAALDGSKHHEWSWESVDRVMKNGGNFRS